MMHEKGLGVIEDLALAAEHFRIAAELGDPIGQTRLGVMYETGLGVDRDAREAADWLTLAAEQGLLEAQTRLWRRFTGRARWLCGGPTWRCNGTRRRRSKAI